MRRLDVAPDDVLSEGERTCVAIAGWLAELHASGNTSAIVLDDPVTSLDHKYRKRVAQLLVREAQNRQVVVFTHDIVFFYMLQSKYRGSGAVTQVSPERVGDKHGIARPWQGCLEQKRSR